MRAENSRHPHPGLGDLFEHDRVRDGVDADPPVLARYQHPEEAHPLHLIDDLGRVSSGELPIARHWRNAPPREIAHEIAKRSLLLGEFEVHKLSNVDHHDLLIPWTP